MRKRDLQALVVLCESGRVTIAQLAHISIFLPRGRKGGEGRGGEGRGGEGRGGEGRGGEAKRNAS